MIYLDFETKEFVARTITDLGKAILTVGFASYFFEKLPLYWRFGIPVVGGLLLAVGVILFSTRKGVPE
ncbi:MAG: hypothetical protein A2Y02_03170 [Omnitrophica bacterium GWA2_52_12]|nr:MAG: hypothetical protein A2Y02_03170 [Omnitrophica bacterium GWA2_52_12]